MEQKKKCPACGEALAPGTAQCPNCQLEGLDQIFLSRADYDNWVRKVLKPHMERLSRRVFSDERTLLILTGEGELYGMGGNSSGQIVEDGGYYIREPVHMASNVISAAVSGHYSIFATEDGKIHIRGRGEFADRVPEFCDAREVFVYGGQFFVVNRQGQVFAFGSNHDGSLEPEQEEVLTAFPKMSAKAIGPFFDSNAPFCYGTRYPSDYDQQHAEWEVRNKVGKSEEYQSFAQRYEPSNLHILLKLTGTARCDTESVQYGSYTKYNQIYDFIPTLVLRNTYLYTPVLYHDQDYANTPHREYAYPLSLCDRRPLESYPQIKKACLYNDSKYLAVCHDGTLVWFDHKETLHRLNWTKAPVHDLAISPYCEMGMISCRDGRVYLMDKDNLPELKILREIPIS